MERRYNKLSIAGLIFCALTLPLAQGCATNQDPRVEAAVADKPFYDWFNNLISQIKADPSYKRLPIDSKAQSNDFLALLHTAWQHKISKREFTQRVNSQYPGHEYETSFIVARLP
ncbi:hypothetical protein AB1287_17105 [Enterobacter asburiae]|uniref:hypothetical protein n=1 Tax=Scandinavium sp. UTDF21-P1B TaxID=3446379 RepID=UPI003473663A